MPRMTGQDLVDALETTWTSLDAVCADLPDDAWRLPTECPGWSVQDNVSHITGLERRMLGEPQPDHQPPADLAHVRNSVGQMTEVAVDLRRSWPPARVLEEFRE